MSMDLTWSDKKRMNKMGSMDWDHSYAKKKNNLYTMLIIKILRLRAVRSMVRMSILTLSLLALYWLVFVTGSSSSMVAPDSDSIISNYLKILPFLCHDLVSEGLIKKGHKGLILGVDNDIMNDDYVFLKDNGVDVETEASLEDQNNVFDFVFAPSLSGIKLIDRVVKNGGLMISLLSNNLLNDEMHSINNYRIVYLRIFDCTVLAMTKLS